jgi:hypothetical protein
MTGMTTASPDFTATKVGRCLTARALILRTKPVFSVLAADAVSIAIAVFAASWFAAALVSGAGQ